MTRLRSVWGIPAVLVLASSGVLVGSVAATSASAAPVVAGNQAWLDNQNELHVFDGKVLAVVDPEGDAKLVSVDGETYGYAGLVDSPATSSVTLYWVGSVPSNIQRIIDSAPTGITVILKSARYTYFQLEMAVQQFSNSDVQASLGAQATIQGVGPATDGSGLDVTYSVPKVSADSSDSTEAEGIDPEETELQLASEIKSAATNATGIAIASVDVVPSAPTMTESRWGDTSPWHGGAGYSYVQSGYGTPTCSTGFPVTNASSGELELLTAYHCFSEPGAAANQAVYTGDQGTGTKLGTWTGNAADIDSINDVTVIRVTPQSLADGVYTGGPGSSTHAPIETTLSVLEPGDYVYDDGAMSGVNGVSVDAVGLCIQDDSVCGAVKADAAGGVAAAAGDSGGPVYSIDSNDNHYPVGIIHGGQSAVACDGTHGTTTCYSTVYFMEMQPIMLALDLNFH